MFSQKNKRTKEKLNTIIPKTLFCTQYLYIGRLGVFGHRAVQHVDVVYVNVPEYVFNRMGKQLLAMIYYVLAIVLKYKVVKFHHVL